MFLLRRSYTYIKLLMLMYYCIPSTQCRYQFDNTDKFLLLIYFGKNGRTIRSHTITNIVNLFARIAFTWQYITLSQTRESNVSIVHGDGIRTNIIIDVYISRLKFERFNWLGATNISLNCDSFGLMFNIFQETCLSEHPKYNFSCLSNLRSGRHIIYNLVKLRPLNM